MYINSLINNMRIKGENRMSIGTKTDPEVIFFLGAGASVKAGVPDTFGFVEAFREKISLQPENLRALDKILEVLKEWKRRQGDMEGKVDIELLLETIERLENRNQDVLLRFHDVRGYVLEGYADKRPLRDELKDFIKEAGILRGSKIRYLEPLLGFIAEYRPLDIFSVNYDICIEQLCNVYKKDYTDGFELKWNPKLFEKTDVDVRLYKLHGSVMWYRTDRGDYVKIPVMSKKAEADLITGERAETLILYPVQKWEYAEPLLELLMELKKRLEKAKFLFVVGYSFRDDHIRRIFWDAARKNKDLIVFLISPNAHKTYLDKIRDYEIPGLPHGFSSDFSSEDFDAAVQSELAGRVICLPYRFEDALPLLRNHYLKNLKEGLLFESEDRKKEIKGEIVEWWACLTRFVECEYMEKVNEIVSKIDWNEYLKDSWGLALPISFKSLLNCYFAGNNIEANEWLHRFSACISILGRENLKFNVMRGPRQIELKFRFTKSDDMPPSYFIERVKELIEICEFKASLLNDFRAEKLESIVQKIKRLYDYLNLWKTGAISCDEYVKLREQKYPELIDKFKQQNEKYQAEYSGEKHAQITAILKEIEGKELMEIYGGSGLQINLE
jgi:hypothetical protein